MKIFKIYDRDKVFLDLKNCTNKEIKELKNLYDLKLEYETVNICFINNVIHIISLYTALKNGYNEVDFKTFKRIHNARTN